MLILTNTVRYMYIKIKKNYPHIIDSLLPLILCNTNEAELIVARVAHARARFVVRIPLSRALISVNSIAVSYTHLDVYKRQVPKTFTLPC